MKKLIITLVTILIVIILIVLVLRERLSKEGILGAIEKQTGLIIELLDEGTWDFYPTITYINSNASITYKDSLLTIQNANIQINKNYWPLSPILINLNSLTAYYQGMEMRNVILRAKYTSSTIHIEILTGNIVEGTIQAKGKIELDDKQPFIIQGQFPS